MATRDSNVQVVNIFDPDGRPIKAELERAMAAVLVGYVRLYGCSEAALRIADLAEGLLDPTEDPRATN